VAEWRASQGSSPDGPYGGLAVVYPAIILVFIAFGCGLLVTPYHC
jgi:hypothetical protein